MRPLAFLRDRIPEMVAVAIALCVAALVLRAAGVERDVVVLACGVVLLGGVVALVADYLRDRDFWRALDHLACGDDSLGDPVAEQSLLPEPSGLRALLVSSALDRVTRAAAVRAEAARTDAEEHREYVETWVHEVKTPIAAARLVTENNPGPETPALTAELDRIDAYVDQALYFARSSSVDRDYVIREVDLRSLVNEVLRSQARILIERGVRIREDDLDEQVLCDAKWMRFCLVQVVGNAAKYPAPAEVNRTPELAFSARRELVGTADERVVLTVRDNGRGIPAADVPRVFDKGFVGENGRGPDATRSTGIGLYLVRRLCEKMGLGVRLASAAGEWTEVEFTFPMNRMHFLDEAPRNEAPRNEVPRDHIPR